MSEAPVAAPASPPLAGRMSFGQIMAFSAITIPVSALGTAMGIFMTRHFATELGMAMMVVGTAFLTVRALDFGIDVALGLLMDRFRTRWGRYRVWFVAGVPIVVAGVAGLFLAPHGINFIYLVSALFVYYLGISMIGLSHAAWRATLVTNYHERSRVFGLMAPVGIIGAIVVLAIPRIAEAFNRTASESVQLIGILVMIFIPICALIVVMTTPERVAPEVPKADRPEWRDYWDVVRKPSFLRLLIGEAGLVLGPGWMSAIYVYFFQYSRGFTFGESSLLLIFYVLAGSLGAPAAGWLANRIGKHRTLYVTTTSYSVGLMTVMLVPRGEFLLMIPTMLWCGFMASGFGLMTSAMTADFADEMRLEQGKERVTLIYSFTSLAAKVAGMFAQFLTLAALTWVGFNHLPGATNTPEAIRGLELTYLLGPIFFVMLGGACFIGWNLDATRHGEIRRQLEERDAQFQEAPILEPITSAESNPRP